MLLSARASLQVAVAVTLAGWIALAGFAWKGFDDAHEEAA